MLIDLEQVPEVMILGPQWWRPVANLNGIAEGLKSSADMLTSCMHSENA
jgi:hypothetical protein